MRKLRSTKKANLFLKGNIFSSESPHGFSHKLCFYCNQFSFFFIGEGSWMKWIYQQRFTSILEATQKILEMLALDSYVSCVRVWGIMFVKIRAC